MPNTSNLFAWSSQSQQVNYPILSSNSKLFELICYISFMADSKSMSISHFPFPCPCPSPLFVVHFDVSHSFLCSTANALKPKSISSFGHIIQHYTLNMALESTARLHANFKAPFPPLHHPQHTIPYPTGIFRFSPFSPNNTTTLLRSHLSLAPAPSGSSIFWATFRNGG